MEIGGTRHTFGWPRSALTRGTLQLSSVVIRTPGACHGLVLRVTSHWAILRIDYGPSPRCWRSSPQESDLNLVVSQSMSFGHEDRMRWCIAMGFSVVGFQGRPSALNTRPTMNLSRVGGAECGFRQTGVLSTGHGGRSPFSHHCFSYS